MIFNSNLIPREIPGALGQEKTDPNSVLDSEAKLDFEIQRIFPLALLLLFYFLYSS